MGIGSLLRRTQAEPHPEATEDAEGSSGIVGTRRNLFKLLGMGAAGAVGASLLDASPAGATTLSTLDVTGTATFTRSGVVTLTSASKRTADGSYSYVSVKVPGGLTLKSHVLLTTQTMPIGAGQGLISATAVPNTQNGEFVLYADQVDSPTQVPGSSSARSAAMCCKRGTRFDECGRRSSCESVRVQGEAIITPM